MPSFTVRQHSDDLTFEFNQDVLAPALELVIHARLIERPE